MSVKERMELALAMHDQLLLNRPEGAAAHDESMCPFCADWSMAEEGVPSGYARLDLADAKQPYGDVEYADPGYQADKVKRYPVDTEAHAKAAWSYIHQAGNAEKYSADQLASIRTKITAALKKFGVEAENKAVEKTKKMADAKSGSNKPNSDSKIQPSDQKASTEAQPVASEGGTTPMETISQETHEALLDKALRDATASLEAEKAELERKVAALEEAASTASEEVASLKSENDRLNGELDTAQVALKSSQDEAEALKGEKAAAEEAARVAEIASKRTTEVRELALFTEEYVADKASLWAAMDEAAWTERLEEWKTVKAQQPAATPASTDSASAMSGSSEIPAGKEPSARRRALGLID
jgi:chromosome segregation ATPase